MKKKFSKSGFTLVELLVAVALFTLVASMSIGALVAIFDANKKAQSTKTVIDNLNFSIENMTRTVRFGSRYHCNVSGSYDQPEDCPNGGDLLAITFNGNVIVYRLTGTTLQISSDGGSTWSDITSPETVVEYLKFYVFGAEDPDDLTQPYAIAVIKGHVGTKSTIQSEFSIETLMSQRNLDI